jgi:hypothetical protein
MRFLPLPCRSPRWITVFHVTHQNSVESIRANGLDPALSRRPAKRVWLADLIALPWAIRHVTMTQGWRLDEIVVLRVTLPREVLTTHRTGVHYVHSLIPPAFLGANFACQY